MDVIARDCYSCGEVWNERCPRSKAECGHHCNHVWTHDLCHWCGEEMEDDPLPPREAVQEANDAREGSQPDLVPRKEWKA